MAARLVGGVGSESHLRSTNVEDGNDVLEENITKDVRALRATVLDTGQAKTSVVLDVLEDEVLGRDKEVGTADSNGELRSGSCALDEVATLSVVENRSGREGSVSCLGDRGGEVGQSGTRVDDGLGVSTVGLASNVVAANVNGVEGVLRRA